MTTGWTIRCSILDRVKNFVSSPDVATTSGARKIFNSGGTGSSFRGKLKTAMMSG